VDTTTEPEDPVLLDPLPRDSVPVASDPDPLPITTEPDGPELDFPLSILI